MNDQTWFEITNHNEFDTPALLIYPSRINENINRMLEKIPPDHLRPHVKTNKSADVSAMMLHAGIKKFKAATIAEAEMLAGINAPDVLLAYPPTVVKLKRFIQLIQKYPGTTFSCLVDQTENAEIISDFFSAAGLKANLFIDLNLGMNRTGITTDKTLALFQKIHSLPAIHIIGLHAYDGHIKARDLKIRTEICHRSFVPVLQLKHDMEIIADRTMTLVAGGSPTSFIHAVAGDRECSPGTFIFWDKGYMDQLPEQPFECAAVLLCRVISIPSSDLVCVDLGYKSIASENPLPRVFFLNAPDAIPTAHSEEHLVLKVPNSNKFKTGDVLYGIPWHICPTVALYDKMLVVENNAVNGFFKVTARDREITV